MNVEFKSSFVRCIKKVRDKRIKALIKETILEIEKADSLSDIPRLERLTSSEPFFKIKKHSYRFGSKIKDSIVVLIKFGSHENFYNDFP